MATNKCEGCSFCKQQKPTRASIGWNNPALSDIVLRIIPNEPITKKRKKRTSEATNNTQEIYVSKYLLVSQSPFFEKLFLNGMKETHQQKVDIVEEPDQIRFFVDMIRSMYTGQFEEDPTQVTMIADKYECEQVLSNCAAVLIPKVNCIEEANKYLALKESLSHLGALSQLFVACETLIVKMYLDLQQEINDDMSKWSELNEHAVEAILQSDSLISNSENAIYRAFEIWLDADRDNRAVHIPKLFSHIRLPMCSSHFVEHYISKHPLIGASQIFKDKLVKECFAFGYTPRELDRKRIAEPDNKMFRCRRYEQHLAVMYLWDFTVPTQAGEVQKSQTFFLDGYPLYEISSICYSLNSHLIASYDQGLCIDLQVEGKIRDIEIYYDFAFEHLVIDMRDNYQDDHVALDESSLTIAGAVPLDIYSDYITDDGRMRIALEINPALPADE